MISDKSSEPPHSGSWDAWLDGYGISHTDTLCQAVSIPTGSSSYQLTGPARTAAIHPPNP